MSSSQNISMVTPDRRAPFQVLTSAANNAPTLASNGGSKLLLSPTKKSVVTPGKGASASSWCAPGRLQRVSSVGSNSFFQDLPEPERQVRNFAREMQENSLPFDDFKFDDKSFSLGDFDDILFSNDEDVHGIPAPPPPQVQAVPESPPPKEESDVKLDLDEDGPLKLSRTQSSNIREQKRINSFHPEEWEFVAKVLFHEDPENRSSEDNINPCAQAVSNGQVDFRSLHKPPNDGAKVSNLGPMDVCTGRGAPTQFHSGNIMFRELVSQHQTFYLCAKRSDKPRVALKVLDILESRGGRMVKRTRVAGRSHWEPIGKKIAFEKVCSALRDGAPELRRKLMVSR